MMNLNEALTQHLQENEATQESQPFGMTGANIAYRRATPQMLIAQREYANILNGLFQKGQELMPSVSQYAGIKGKLTKGIDSIKHGLGADSPQYADYLQFTRIVAPMIANEMRRSLGGQATDYEAKLMQRVIKPDHWDSNPKQALQQFNDLYNIYKKKVIPALLSNPSETPKELKKISEEKEEEIKTYNPQTGMIE